MRLELLRSHRPGGRLVAARDRQEDHHGQDRGQEERAGNDRAEPEAAVGLRLREVVADRRAERAGQDVGDPEREHGVHAQPVVTDSDGGDHPREHQRRERVADAEPLRGEVAGGGAESEREEHREPVERLASSAVDRVDRECPLARPPYGEDDGEHDREADRRDNQRDAEVVGQIVRDQRPDDADQDDGQPVDRRHVAPQPELGDERGDEQRSHDVGRVRQAEAEVVVEEVGGGLADSRAEDLDHPEVEGDLGHLVQHRAERRGARHGPGDRCRCHAVRIGTEP